jgi:hypothetical protein
MRLSEEELANMKAATPAYETAADGAGWRLGSYQLSAFRSCAKHLGLPLGVVLRAAGTNRLGALIEKRNGSGRNVEKRNLTRIRNLYRKREIAARQVPIWT